MNRHLDFHKAVIPKTRKADYYVSGMNDAVFIDFNRTEDNLILLVRISFDGYGCCQFGDKGMTLNPADSVKFIEEMNSDNLNSEIISELVKEIIKINKDHIWIDAIKEYKLI